MSCVFALKNLGDLVGARDDHVQIHSDQFFCEGERLIGIAASPTKFKLDIAALDPAEASKPLPKCHCVGPSLLVAFGVPHQQADPPHAIALLRGRSDRPHDRPKA